MKTVTEERQCDNSGSITQKKKLKETYLSQKMPKISGKKR